MAWVATLTIGVSWRAMWIFVDHPPQKFVYADMRHYLWHVNQILSGAPTHPMEAFYPPGTTWYMAGLLAADPTGFLFNVVQWVICCSIPIIILFIGRELYGWEVGLWASSMANVHFPLIDGAGYYMAENPFTLGILLSFWLLVRALRAVRTDMTVGWSLAAGVMVGVTALFKTVILVPAFLAAALALWFCRRRGVRWMAACVLPMVLGALLVLVPATLRASRILGTFTPVGANGALNFLQGHYGRVGHFSFHFNGEKHSWGSPAALQKGFNERVTLDVPPWDHVVLHRLAWKWINEHPLEAFMLSLEHPFDLFIDNIAWPTANTEFRAWMVISQHALLIFVMVPLFLLLGTVVRPVSTGHRWTARDSLVLMPVLGLLLVAFCVMAEARYRIPFDPFLLLLAARWYASADVDEDDVLRTADDAGAVA